jgi:hypothetical protein
MVTGMIEGEFSPRPKSIWMPQNSSATCDDQHFDKAAEALFQPRVKERANRPGKAREKTYLHRNGKRAKRNGLKST